MIQSVTITGKSPGPKLLITGGVHGDEFEPMEAARHLMQVIKPESLNGSVTLAPVVNEAAFLNGARCADDGLDMARTCPGRHDGSITQRTAAALSELIRGHDHYIDMHTGGTAFVVHTLAGYALHRDEKILQTQRRMARAFNLPLVWGTTAKMEGRSLSVARDANVPAIYVEAGGGGSCQQWVTDAYIEGCLNVMNELRMRDQSPAKKCEIEVVEDHRDHSGHLQIQYLAGATGFYQPSVTLGQRVIADQSCGRIIDVLGRELAQVTSQEAGMVVMLRAMRRAMKDEPLMALASSSGGNA